MYCKHCGKQIDDDAKFCSFCGTPVDALNMPQNNVKVTVPEQKKEVVTDKWIWALATVPTVMGWVIGALLASMGIGDILTTIIIIAMNITFLTLDVKEVRKTGMNVDSWLYLGIILVPVYLFVRESKTNRNNLPGIVWCVLFVIGLLI